MIRKPSREKERRIWIIYYFFMALIFCVTYIFFTFNHPTLIIGSSMEPTLSNGDLVKTDTSFSESDLDYGVIVCVRTPNEKSIVKRIVALPGDIVSTCDGYIYVNGEPIIYSGDSFEKIILGDNEYFVLGDNIENSKDSRYYGAFEYEQIERIVLNKIIGKNKEIN